MIRILALIACLVPAAALTQSGHGGHNGGSATTHSHDMHQQSSKPKPTEPGQSAFAAIQEIVGILEADPNTDWSKVNIDALRQHLIDMSNVTLEAEVTNEPVDGGMRFVVTGIGPVRDSIQRMVTSHAAIMNGVDGWRFEAAEIGNGAALTVRPPAQDVAMLRGLGFFGIMTLGMHHQHHHMMIARGQNPHHSPQ